MKGRGIHKNRNWGKNDERAQAIKQVHIIENEKGRRTGHNRFTGVSRMGETGP